MKSFAVALCALLGSAQAAPVSFTINGELGANPARINSTFDGASFSGSLSFDDEALLPGSTDGDRSYALTDWSIDVTATSGEMLSITQDGEPLDSGSATVNVFGNGLIAFDIFEDIDNPATRAEERRFFQIRFEHPQPGTPFTPLTDLANSPTLSADAAFIAGLLQFSTSQVSTPIVSATISGSSVPMDPVPLPAGLPLMISGLGALVTIRRRRR
ncbi:MAG: VPLPA-CTERM sorting domain-containing protein [Pseudomonadota bacterium]